MGRKRTVHHGLPPRMARKGQSYYYVCNAPRRWIALGNDLAVAKRRWAELEAPDSTLTVGQLVQRYVDRAERPESTRKQYQSYQRALDRAFPIPASELLPQHVALWRELSPQRSRANYVNGAITVLMSACRYGHEQGLCQLIVVGKLETEKRGRIVSADEFRAIREKAPTWLRCMMDLGYLTSLRPSDLRSLRWSQVGESAITVQHQKTKKRQEIAITGDLAAVLAEARARPIVGLYVVATDKGQPITRNQQSFAWKRSCAAAGVSGVQFRDIRSMAAQAGEASGIDIQALLGHSSRRMSEHYLRGTKTIKAQPVARKL